ncbi:MAG: hypothetical protein KC416_10020 [Myxococcales bacterium]|nr:hypothetical protein [Myxococcales bacterium]
MPGEPILPPRPTAPSIPVAAPRATPSRPTAPPFVESLGDALRASSQRLNEGEVLMDRALRRGRTLDHTELLALQAGIYRYSQELDLVSRLVDRGTQALRQTLQSQGS